VAPARRPRIPLSLELVALSLNPRDPDPRETVDVAGRILADAGFTRGASPSGARLAWAKQASALSGLIPLCADAMRGEIDAAQTARRALIDRLVRVLIMLWLIDPEPSRRGLIFTD
jgi:hypothetical protein